MAVLIEPHHHAAFADLLDEAFRLRRRVFVEALGWDLPPGDGVHERDEFDDGFATHLLAMAPDGSIGGYLRLLRGDRPMLINTIFAYTLDMKPAETGPHVHEITRMCASPTLPDRATRYAVQQDIHISHLEYCFSRAVRTALVYTSLDWLSGAAGSGMEIEMLGTPRPVGGQLCAPAAFQMTDQVRELVRAAFGDTSGYLQDPGADPALLVRYGAQGVAA